MHGNAKKWREKMGEIIFGVIGIGIISAAFDMMDVQNLVFRLSFAALAGVSIPK